jgi:DNA-directed RNA polymerase I, II, and III subunit RPABC1
MEDLWKINRTLLQKLADTKYLVSEDDKKSVSSLASFEASFPTLESMERIFKPLPNEISATRCPSGVLLCFALLQESKKYIRVEDVRHVLALMAKTGVTTALFIINSALSPKAADILRSSQAPGLLRVVVFEHREILFNVTRHSRVPKHQLLTASEAHEWITKSKLKRSQMPRAFETDPQIKYIDGLNGDIVRIIRPSPTCGTFVHHVVIVRKLGK